MSRLEHNNRCITRLRIADDRVRRPERGRGKLGTAVVSAVLIVVGFVGYNVVPFYYYYFELTNQLRALISTADRNNDAAIRARVMQIVRELEIPAVERDVQIDRRDGVITITLPYSEVIYFTFQGKEYDLYRLRFRASAAGAF